MLDCQDCLASGVAILGIAGNLDQYLNISLVQAAGVGRLLRGGQLSSALMREAVEDLLADSQAGFRANMLRSSVIIRMHAPARFAAVLEKIMGMQHGNV
jgi:UDP:flavonoid glycosyltransferase YjiC (YdhE family)